MSGHMMHEVANSAGDELSVLDVSSAPYSDFASFFIVLF